VEQPASGGWPIIVLGLDVMAVMIMQGDINELYK
jgi:hypothetical protein